MTVALMLAMLVPLVVMDPARALASTPETKHGTHEAGVLPTQRTGTADGQPHLVDGGHNTNVPPSQRTRYPQKPLPQPPKPANSASLQPSPKVVATKGFDPLTSKENVSKRTPTKQVFDNADGTQTSVLASAPVNYQDAHGTWQPIRPSLTPDLRPGVLRGALVSGGGAADVRLAPRLSAQPVTDAVTSARHQLQTLTGYDDDGNVIRVEQRDLLGTDQPRVTSYDYDDHNHQDRVTDPAGHETSYSYDDSGNKTGMLDPNGNSYEYAYTARNALAEVRLQDPTGQGSASDDAGQHATSS